MDGRGAVHGEEIVDEQATPSKCCCWDDTDNNFPPYRIFFLVGSFLFFFIDVSLDIWVAVEYYVADQQDTDVNARYYLAATLFFIVVPAIIVNFVSWALYTWGWLIYRNRRLNSYCCKRLQPMELVHRKKNIADVRDSILVHGIHAINWSRPVNQGGQIEMNRVTGHRRKNSSQPIVTDTDAIGRTEPDSGLQFYPLDLLDNSEYIAVTIIHLFMLGYLFRVIRLLYARKHDKYSFDRYRDISFLRLMESFLESAPQVVLQLYILVVLKQPPLWYLIITPISILVSIMSLALSVADYISASKDVTHYDPAPNKEKKPRLSWLGYFAVIFWHFFMILARGLAFSLFATVYGPYVLVMAGVHYLIMVYWMYWQKARIFKRRPEDFVTNSRTFDSKALACRECMCLCARGACSNYGLEFIAAAFNTFFHFKIKDNGAIVTLIPFYTLTFVENALMILLWYFGRDYKVYIWYSIPAVVTVFLAFVIGFILLVLYYLFCQPSKRESLELDESLEHPTMTSTLNRMYEMKVRRGNFFKRAFYCK